MTRVVEAMFFCKTGALAGSEYRIGDDVTIGRGPGNAIVVQSDVVSTSHARIAFDAAANAYFLEDLDSRNGTRLDGQPVSGWERLGDLHVITVGAQHDFLFVVVPAGRSPARAAAASDAEASAPRPKAVATCDEAPQGLGVPSLKRAGADAGPGTRYEPPLALAVPVFKEAADAGPGTRYEAPPALAVPMLKEAADAGPGTRYEASPALAVPVLKEEADADPAARYDAPSALVAPPLDASSSPPSGVVLEVRTPEGESRRITLEDGRHVLGRSRDCSIPVNDRRLSRRHAAFVVRGDRLTVTDLGSLNGTYLGEKAVAKPAEVDVGQTVTLGDRVKVARVAPDGAPALEGGGASDGTVGGL